MKLNMLVNNTNYNNFFGVKKALNILFSEFSLALENKNISHMRNVLNLTQQFSDNYKKHNLNIVLNKKINALLDYMFKNTSEQQ